MTDVRIPCYYLAPNFYESAGAFSTVIDPATLEDVGQRGETNAAEVEDVINKVNAAQKRWSKVDSKTRAAYLHRLAERIEAMDITTCAILMSREMGKPYPEAIGEIANCAPVFRYYAEMARDEAGKIAGTTQSGSFQYARYEPLGVSVHIMPFNFPILLMCWTVAASLAAGNGCVVKPAEATTLSTLEFMKAFDEIPESLIACLPGGHALGESLIADEKTHAVAFTGSVVAARSVAAAAGERMKPALIEAGGSDAMLISSTAPLDIAVAGAVTGAFHMSGQVCTSTERIYVVEEVHDAFVEAFVARTQQLRIGNGLEKSEIGPLVSEAARDRVARLVADALSKGARLACGGSVPKGLSTGWFYEPTILTNCSRDMDVLKEEVFGPVASIVRAPDFNTAIDMANDSCYGLGASIFTTNLREAHESVERLESGMVWINNPLIDNDALPFGGWKRSGIGRELSRMGLDTFRRSKMVVLDHKPSIQDWWYPYPDEWFLESGGRKHV